MSTVSTTASRRALSTPELLTSLPDDAPSPRRLDTAITLNKLLSQISNLLVRTAGFEPALPIGKRILSPQRLPFRHVRSCSHGDGRCSQGYSAVTSLRFKRSRISLPGLKYGTRLASTDTDSPVRGLRPTRRVALTRREGAEAAKLDPAALGELVGDGIENRARPRLRPRAA